MVKYLQSFDYEVYRICHILHKNLHNYINKHMYIYIYYNNNNNKAYIKPKIIKLRYYLVNIGRRKNKNKIN